MATYEKISLSNSPQGAGLYLSTFTETTVHATGNSSSVMDEVWLYLTNYQDDNVTIVVRVDGTAVAKIQITATDNVKLVIPGFMFKGSGVNPLTISAEKVTPGGDVYVFGYVNRITP